MNKEELIALLKDIPNETKIYLSVDEDQNLANNVNLISNEEEEFYAKGDKPSAFGAEFPYIIIS